MTWSISNHSQEYENRGTKELKESRKANWTPPTFGVDKNDFSVKCAGPGTRNTAWIKTKANFTDAKRKTSEMQRG